MTDFVNTYTLDIPRYIGLALAISGSVAIGTSFIITKKGVYSQELLVALSSLSVAVREHTTKADGLHGWILAGLIDAANRSSSNGVGKQGPVDPKEYLKNPLWWAGSKYILAVSYIQIHVDNLADDRAQLDLYTSFLQ